MDAKRFTFDRIDENNLTEYNKRGIFEIAELYYKDDRQIDKPVVSATNNGYSESYAVRNTAAETVESAVYSLMQAYFTREQLNRSVVYV